MFKGFAKRALENVKGTVKKEIVQCADDIFPTMVGIASVVLLVAANVPPQKPVAQQLIINNFYLR